jgi:hypothetical protein
VETFQPLPCLPQSFCEFSQLPFVLNWSIVTNMPVILNDQNQIVLPMSGLGSFSAEINTNLELNHQTMKTQTTRLIKSTVLAAAILAGLCMTNSTFAGKTPPPHSSAFGQTLTAWDDLYFRWLFGNVTIPTDANGNAVVNGVVLLPLPNAAGDGTPASVDVTLTTAAFYAAVVESAGHQLYRWHAVRSGGGPEHP